MTQECTKLAVLVVTIVPGTENRILLNRIVQFGQDETTDFIMGLDGYCDNCDLTGQIKNVLVPERFKAGVEAL